MGFFLYIVESFFIGLLWFFKVFILEREGVQDNIIIILFYFCELENKIMFEIFIENVIVEIEGFFGDRLGLKSVGFWNVMGV